LVGFNDTKFKYLFDMNDKIDPIFLLVIY